MNQNLSEKFQDNFPQKECKKFTPAGLRTDSDYLYTTKLFEQPGSSAAHNGPC